MAYYESTKPLLGKIIRGFKGFNADLSCRPILRKVFRYEVGMTYAMDAPVVLCRQGFHFCRSVLHVYFNYPRAFDTRICEVEAAGPCEQSLDETKCVTGNLRIVRELSPEEILEELHSDPSGCDTSRCDTVDALQGSISFYKKTVPRYMLWQTLRGGPYPIWKAWHLRKEWHYPTKKELAYLDNRAAEWEAAFEKYKNTEDGV